MSSVPAISLFISPIFCDVTQCLLWCLMCRYSHLKHCYQEGCSLAFTEVSFFLLFQHFNIFWWCSASWMKNWNVDQAGLKLTCWCLPHLNVSCFWCCVKLAKLSRLKYLFLSFAGVHWLILPIFNFSHSRSCYFIVTVL